jgi:hypothetical protein
MGVACCGGCSRYRPACLQPRYRAVGDAWGASSVDLIVAACREPVPATFFHWKTLDALIIAARQEPHPILANSCYSQKSMIALKTTFTDLELSGDGKLLLQEAMLELEADEQDKAKKIVKNRLLEIKRLETMLARAKADLAELLERDQTEILMLEGN